MARKKPRFTPTNPPPGERYLTPEEVAARFGISIRTLQKWIAAGRIPQPVRLSHKCVRWLESVIVRTLHQLAEGEGHGVAAAQPTHA